MRHRKSRLRLRQKPAHSRSLQRNIVTSLLLYEAVRTTKKRAEVIRPMVDKLITAAKTKPTHVAIRFINQYVTHVNASKKTMEVFRTRYATRSSGFTRMIALGARKGDGAELVSLELVDRSETTSAPSEPTKKPVTASKAARTASKTKKATKASSASSAPASPHS